MRIAVCDDEPIFSAALLDKIRECIRPGDDFDVSVFDSGGSLILAYREPQPFDLILLDIKMPGLNGIATAKEIRKHDPDVVIIVITSFKEYVFQAFDIQAFHYLLKPIKLDKFEKVFRSAIDIRKLQGDTHIMIDTKEKSVLLPLSKIIYCESFRRILSISTEDGCYRCYRRISELDAILPKRDFYMVHKSCIIGLRHVAAVDKLSRIVRMKNGQTQTVSKRRLDGLMLAIKECGRVKL